MKKESDKTDQTEKAENFEARLEHAVQGAVISISGQLGIKTVEPALKKTKVLLNGLSESRVIINCEQIQRCSSAGLAFVTEMLRESKKKGIRLKFENIPAQMQQVSAVNGLTGLLFK